VIAIATWLMAVFGLVWIVPFLQFATLTAIVVDMEQPAI
jgi:hypothetical protein